MKKGGREREGAVKYLNDGGDVGGEEEAGEGDGMEADGVGTNDVGTLEGEEVVEWMPGLSLGRPPICCVIFASSGSTLHKSQNGNREKDRDEREGRSLLLFVHLKCYCLLASSFTQSDD